MNVNNQMIDDMMAAYGYEWNEPNMEYVNGDKIVSGDFASEMCKRLNAFQDVDRFEVIDHRECVWCRGRKLENRLVKGEYKEMPCSKCDGSGIMGGRVYTVSSNPERSIIAIDLSYQDNGKTLKVFVKDRG